jgi:pantoate--beta-alanine ligase
MDVVETVTGCRDLLAAVRAAGRTVGFVPTMGALHAGHVSLMARAADECDAVVVSIFVNPLQFGDPEDIAKYPRTIEADLRVCEAAGVDIVFIPATPEMYPNWPNPVPTSVSVSGVSEGWEGASRPGHFDGVATVVAKLFSIAGPCRAYFGEKDYQQLAVVRQMTVDLALPVDVVGCSIVREPDGLALSSRNVRLSAEERQAATVLSAALAAGRDMLARTSSALAVRQAMTNVVAAEPLVELDYADLVGVDDLVARDQIPDAHLVRLIIAAQVGPVRLIDNCSGAAVSQHPSPSLARSARLLERIR